MAMFASLPSFLIGVVAGMRSVSAPALVSHRLSRVPGNFPPHSPFHLLKNPQTARILAVLAGVELIGDKLPNVPDRITPQSILFRAGSGAVCGAALEEAQPRPARLGAILGATGALTGTFTFFYLRRYLTHNKGLPDPLIALLEDAVAIGLGWQAVGTTPAQCAPTQ